MSGTGWTKPWRGVRLGEVGYLVYAVEVGTHVGR
jgi:hypothetical protein